MKDNQIYHILIKTGHQLYLNVVFIFQNIISKEFGTTGQNILYITLLVFTCIISGWPSNPTTFKETPSMPQKSVNFEINTYLCVTLAIGVNFLAHFASLCIPLFCKALYKCFRTFLFFFSKSGSKIINEWCLIQHNTSRVQ